MIHSMTGFANGSKEYGHKRLYIEIKSVNHRYLDIGFRMNEELRHLENGLRELFSREIVRGKIECRVQLHGHGRVEDEAQWQINKKLIGQLCELNHKIRKQYPDVAKLGVADILAFPGVLVSAEDDVEDLKCIANELAVEVLAEFNQSRQREGEKLREHLLKRLQSMEDIVEILVQLFPQLLQQYMDKVEQRLRDAVHNMHTDRLQQEFAIFMQKADVDEEFSRLRTHIEEVRRIVNSGKGSMGKRLDFLMQELNREANTLGSKSIAAECTQASVELKVLIEQMREQVQNIE